MLAGLLTLPDILAPAQAHGFAVGAFCAPTAEMVEAVLRAAEAEAAPVIVMIGPGEQNLLGVAAYGVMVQALAARYDLPVCLHYDHGLEMERLREAVGAGYPAVMLDASNQPYAGNVALTQEAVQVARPSGASVEAEIGHVGVAGGGSHEVIGEGETHLTDPEEAERFAAETGVDALAISVGTAHGLGAGLPELDWARLEEIHRRVTVPLVLHGATGRAPEQMRRAVELGIRKVNVASELARIYAETVGEAWQQGGGFFWHSTVLTTLRERVTASVRGHLQVLGSSGQAGRY